MKNIQALRMMIVAIAFVLGMGFQYGMATQFMHTKSQEKIILYWVAPMDPSYRRDAPGKSPMGMDLVPVYAERAQLSADDVVRISPTVVHNLGVRTTSVQRQSLSREIDTVGVITANDNHVEHVHVYTPGWIRSLAIKSSGDAVQKGQLLFRIYAPQVVNAQAEYLLARRNQDVVLQKAAIKKLQALGFSDQQLSRLQQRGVAEDLMDVYATQTGVVSQLNVGEGMYVKPDHVVMVVEDLSSVWLIAEVPARQASWVNIGQKARMTLPYFPGQSWQGQVNYIYPSLDAVTQTLKLRLRFDNPDGVLKLNMYGDVTIAADVRDAVMVIPRASVIYGGTNTRVVVQVAEGQFRVQSVQLGIESGDQVEVVSGLDIGDRVVTSAQFLLDSESSLHAGIQRMTADAHVDDATHAGHAHNKPDHTAVTGAHKHHSAHMKDVNAMDVSTHSQVDDGVDIVGDTHDDHEAHTQTRHPDSAAKPPVHMGCSMKTDSAVVSKDVVSDTSRSQPSPSSHSAQEMPISSQNETEPTSDEHVHE